MPDNALDTLIREATMLSSWLKHHRLGRWHIDSDGSVARVTCERCGAFCRVDARPEPALGADILGSATTMECPGTKPEEGEET